MTCATRPRTGPFPCATRACEAGEIRFKVPQVGLPDGVPIIQAGDGVQAEEIDVTRPGLLQAKNRPTPEAGSYRY